MLLRALNTSIGWEVDDVTGTFQKKLVTQRQQRHSIERLMFLFLVVCIMVVCISPPMGRRSLFEAASGVTQSSDSGVQRLLENQPSRLFADAILKVILIKLVTR